MKNLFILFLVTLIVTIILVSSGVLISRVAGAADEPITFSKKVNKIPEPPRRNETIIPAPRPQMKALLNKFGVFYEENEEVFYKWLNLVNQEMAKCGNITLKNANQQNIIGKINALLMSDKCNE